MQTAGDPAADYRHRIWMPTGEIPFAGHPSLGVAAAVARERGQDAVTYHQQTIAGVQPVDVEMAGGVAHCSMLQEPLETGEELDPAEVMAALGLDASAAHPELPCQPVSTGLRHVLAPVRDDPGALSRMRPDPERVGRLLAAHGCRLPLRRDDRSRARPRPRALVLRRRGGPGHGLRRRAALRVARRPHRERGARGDPGRGDGPRLAALLPARGRSRPRRRRRRRRGRRYRPPGRLTEPGAPALHASARAADSQITPHDSQERGRRAARLALPTRPRRTKAVRACSCPGAPAPPRLLMDRT